MKLRQTHVIANVNHKGGCGKTTTTVNLGAALAELGFSVCTVDIDEQCNMSTGLGVDINAHTKAGRYTTLDIYLNKREAKAIAVPLIDAERNPRCHGRMKVIPGHRQLNNARRQLDVELQHALAHEHASELDEDELKDEQRKRLKVSLDTLRGEFDVVLIDTPPDLGFLTTTALLSADWLIVPVFPSAYDLDGLEKLQATRSKVAKRYNPRLNFLGVVLGRVDLSAKLDIDIYTMLRDSFGERMFKTRITSAVKQREAPVHGQTIFEHAPNHQAAAQFRDLGREVVDRLIESEDTQEAASLHQSAEGVGKQLIEVNR